MKVGAPHRLEFQGNEDGGRRRMRLKTRWGHEKASQQQLGHDGRNRDNPFTK